MDRGNVIARKYCLLRPLARGGMASVWVAQHLQLDVEVAVKFMASDLADSPDARARFEREAKSSAQLSSKHVVRVHDYGVEKGAPYIVMELLAGEDLATRLKRVHRLGLGETKAIARQICKALRIAHEAKLVHRDLKPGNVFLAQDDGDELLKVLDFGIAKQVGTGAVGEATKTGMLIGSPHYMSPERARGVKDIDHRSDLWSLAVLLYRCLTANLPFPGEEIGDVLVKVCTEPFPAPSSVEPDLPREVDAFFERALARRPADRFQSAAEIAAAFEALPEGAAMARAAPAAGEQASLPAPDPTKDIAGAAPAQDRGSDPTEPITASCGPAPLSVPAKTDSSTLSPANRSVASSSSHGARTAVTVAVLALALAGLVTSALVLGPATEPKSEQPMPARSASEAPSPTAMVPPAPPRPASGTASAPAGAPQPDELVLGEHATTTSLSPAPSTSQAARPPSPAASAAPQAIATAPGPNSPSSPRPKNKKNEILGF